MLKRLVLLGLLVPFAGSPAFAQTKGATASADIAMYQGADRTQRLIEGAKKEGMLTVYKSVRRGHTLLTNLVVAGEVPLALTVYHYKTEQLKNSGAPIDWFMQGNLQSVPIGG